MDYITLSENYLKSKIKDYYRLAHSYRVANIGTEIAKKEGFNILDLQIACLLHDVSYCRSFDSQEEWLNHGRVSAQMVYAFLQDNAYPKSHIHDICFAIAIHVDLKADFEGEYTPFTLSVQEADNIDRMDAYRIYDTLESIQFSTLSTSRQMEFVNSMLKQLEEYQTYTCSTKTAQSLWDDRIRFQLDYYTRLHRQLKISTTI